MQQTQKIIYSFTLRTSSFKQFFSLAQKFSQASLGEVVETKLAEHINVLYKFVHNLVTGLVRN